jgi:hypothetical protein
MSAMRLAAPWASAQGIRVGDELEPALIPQLAPTILEDHGDKRIAQSLAMLHIPGGSGPSSNPVSSSDWARIFASLSRSATRSFS